MNSETKIIKAMEIINCKCGKARMTYKIVGIDKWIAEAFNTNISKSDGVCICRCGECGSAYDTYDPFMVRRVKHFISMPTSVSE